MSNLNTISQRNGISIKRLADIAQKERNVVTTRVIELVQMFEKHPAMLDKLIRSW